MLNKLIHQQCLLFLNSKKLVISGFLIILLIAAVPAIMFSTIDFKVGVTFFNPYFIFIALIPSLLIFSSAFVHYRLIDIYILKTRHIIIAQMLFQILTITVIYIGSWMMFSIVVEILLGNGPVINREWGSIFFISTYILIATFLLNVINRIFILCFNQKFLAFILTFVLNSIAFSLRKSHKTSLIYDFSTINHPLQFISNTLILCGITLLCVIILTTIVMRKDLI